MAQLERKRWNWKNGALLGLAGLAVLAATSGVSLAEPSKTARNAPATSAVRTGAFAEAARLLAERAKSGDHDAQYQLASLYRAGRGVNQDDAQAFKWMLAAAKGGLAKAQYHTGRMLLSGRGIAASPKEAGAWIGKAAGAGHADAIKLLAEINTTTPSAAGTATRGAAARKAEPPSPANTVAVAAQPVNIEGARPVLAEAAWRGDKQAVTAALAAGADVNARDGDGNTALILAAGGGHLPVLEILYAAKAALNLANAAGETALVLAIAKSRTDAVRSLLVQGADREI
ncbi:MAG: ankyrin repeat domain-containing protein, partial [Hyphomicrobium sp.]